MNEADKRAGVEIYEISKDPLRFYKYCKINDPLKGVINFEPWPHQVLLTRAFLEHLLIIILKARQLGVSYVVAFYVLWVTMFRPGSNSLLLSAGEREASRLLDKAKFAYYNLPDWLQTVTGNVGKSSESEFTFPYIGSRIASYPSTETPTLGEAATLVVNDEGAYHKYPESDFASTEPCTSAGGQAIDLSNPNKQVLDSYFNKKYTLAKLGQNGYHAIFLPADSRPDRDKDWFEREKKIYTDKLWEWEQNYPMTEEEALSPISARSFFDKDVLTRLLSGCSKPIEERENGVKIYSYWRPGVTYVAGADESQGQGGDYQCLVVIGKSGITAEVCAVIHSNLIAPDVFAHVTTTLLSEYKNPLLAGEANPIGIAYLQTLQQLNYPNLYYSDKDRQKVGIVTNQKNKELALVDLAGALRTGELITRYEEQVKEMFSFQRSDNGKLESIGGHDDTVMALALGWQIAKTRPVVTGKKRKPTLVTRTVRGMYGN